MPHTPLALGFAILAADGSHAVFMDKRKLGRTEPRPISPSLPTCDAPGDLEAPIAALAKAGAKIALDPVLAADRLRTLVEDNGGTVVAAPDPARLPARHQEPAPRSPAPAPRTAAMARRSPSFCAGSTARSRARSTRSPS